MTKTKTKTQKPTNQTKKNVESLANQNTARFTSTHISRAAVGKQQAPPSCCQFPKVCLESSPKKVVFPNSGLYTKGKKQTVDH